MNTAKKQRSPVMELQSRLERYEYKIAETNIQPVFVSAPRDPEKILNTLTLLTVFSWASEDGMTLGDIRTIIWKELESIINQQYPKQNEYNSPSAQSS